MSDQTPAVEATIPTSEKLDAALAEFAASEEGSEEREVLRLEAKELATQMVREEIARIEAIISAPQNKDKPGKKAAARRQANLLREKIGLPALVSGSSSTGVSDTTPRVSDNVLALLAD